MKKIIYFIVSLAVVVSVIWISSNAQNYRYGDTNLDGEVTARDARTTLRVAAGMDMLESEESFFCSDMNGDHMIKALDARLILRCAAKLDPVITFTFPDYSEQSVAPQTQPPTVSPTAGSPMINAQEPFTVAYVNPYASGRPELPEVPEYEVTPNSFAIISFGYGHGVGMSQYGAMCMNRRGYNYLQILSHYYLGIEFQSENPPGMVTTYDGVDCDTYEFLCRSVEQEMGADATYMEALKAQAIVCYTMLKYYNYHLPTASTFTYKSSMSSVSEATKRAVKEVFGLYMTYNGAPICSSFGAMSAGITANEKDVWGSDYPYLAPVESYDDITAATYLPWVKFITVKTYSAEAMRTKIENYDSDIRLSDYPGDWLEVLEHDGVISSQIGYVTKMRIGDKIISSCAGQKFRQNVLGYGIRSHCMYIVYFDDNLCPHLLFK